MTRNAAPVLLWVLAGLAGPVDLARADPLEAFGFGPRSAAMGTAGVADGEALAAATLNPAAAASGAGPALALGWLFAVPDARLNGRDADLDAAHGVLLAAVVPFRLGSVPFGAALSLHVPDRFVARAELLGGTDPSLFRWDRWIQRTSATLVLAAGLADGLTVGLGATLLADAAAVGTVSVDAPGGSTRASADLTVEAAVRAAAVAGLRFEPAPWLALGFTFRDEISMDVDVDLTARADLEEAALSGAAHTRLRGTAYYSPRSLTLGFAFRRDGWTAAVDVAWRNWSGLSLPWADIELAIDLGAPAHLVNRAFPHPRFQDTIVPAAGLEYAFAAADRHRLAVRAGYAFEPSPVPDQSGLSNLADPDRHLLSLGLGWSADLTPDALPDDGAPAATGPVLDLAFAFQAHCLAPFSTPKDLPEFAGSTLSAEGWVWAGQFWLAVTL